jgi:hypothetical protein
MNITDEEISITARRALERARALGVREFALERSCGEFDYLRGPSYNPQLDSAEVLRQIANLRISG